MTTPVVEPPLVLPPPATIYEKASWILLALGLFIVIEFHLLSGLLAGLFVYALIHGIAERIRGRRLNHQNARVVALAIVGGVTLVAATGLILLTITFIKGRIGHLPELIDKLAAVLENGRDWIRSHGLGDIAPGVETEDLPEFFASKLREHKEALHHAGSEGVRLAVHSIIGIVIGALVSFEHRVPKGPFALALSERVRRLSDAFHAVVFAQIKISALNTVLTAIYLLAVLPMMSVHIELRLRYTLIAITFLFGLLPVVGNLISNSAIVLISAGVSPTAGVASLIFLIVIHKLEYFVNAQIMGTQIHAAAWEMLIVIFTFEAIFGIPGVIIAPIAYAYAKNELIDRKLI